MIEKRLFGGTGLEVSALGFGGGPIGYLGADRETVATILNRLLDCGVNLIDTAAAYEDSEDLIGAAVSGRRDQFLLVSKCGRSFPDVPGESWSAEVVTATIERSLRRLRTDRLDVMLLHSCTLEILKRGEALEALVRAREAGKIRHAGFSGDNEAAAFAAEHSEVDVVETSVNICDQSNIDVVLPVACRDRVAVMAKRPLANAAWKLPEEHRGVYISYSADYFERFRAMGLRPEDLGFSGPPDEAWPEIALRFVLTQPDVSTAIVGTTDPRHAERNLELAAKGPLPEAAVARLRQAFKESEARAGSPWPGLT